MTDDISALFKRAEVGTQRLAQYIADNAPAVYEKGKTIAKSSASKIQPTIDAAIEKAPTIMENGRVAAGNIYEKAPTILRDGRTASMRMLQDPKPFVQKLLDICKTNTRRHPFIAMYLAITLLFGPLWPLRVLLKIGGFGAGGVEPKSRAAARQSQIGNVSSGSLFSMLQSLGNRFGL